MKQDFMQSAQLKDYNADHIQILEGLEAVRKRPSMYIGNTSAEGLHHMIYEIVDNAADEALAGFCTSIRISLNKDGSVTVTDNGRGIPAGIQKKTGLSSIQIVFTILHAGGKFDGSNYKVSGGLHGVGAAVVNALSCRLFVRVNQNGHSYFQEYERGIPKSPVIMTGNCSSDEHGTAVTFYPDPAVFKEIAYDYNTLQRHLKETAFLIRGLTISFYDLRQECRCETFCYKNGLTDFVNWLGRHQTPLYPCIIAGSSASEDFEAEFALIHHSTYSEQLLSFANNISTPEGGTHVIGFRSALTRAVNDYAKKQKLRKEDGFTREELSEGLCAVISVRLRDPQFEGQTKQKLGSSSARPIVENLVYEKLTIFLEQNPQTAKIICEKALLAQRAKKAARSAREIARRKNTLSGMTLPGKLSDCSSRLPKHCELFIVEGDSAGGSAKMARCRENQAVLPLRGKILNVEKAAIDKVCSNEEIKTMISAFGTGILEHFSLDQLRYHKIILMTDADVDGAHITTLLLTFLYRFMPELIKNGHVYLAQPPLFRVEKNKKFWYAYNDEGLDAILNEIGRDSRLKIQRYKGLGEMDAVQLWETTMDPAKRILLRVTLEEPSCTDGLSCDIDRTFTVLMGDEVEPRRNFILANARYTTRLDI